MSVGSTHNGQIRAMARFSMTPPWPGLQRASAVWLRLPSVASPHGPTGSGFREPRLTQPSGKWANEHAKRGAPERGGVST